MVEVYSPEIVLPHAASFDCWGGCYDVPLLHRLFQVELRNFMHPTDFSTRALVERLTVGNWADFYSDDEERILQAIHDEIIDAHEHQRFRQELDDMGRQVSYAIHPISVGLHALMWREKPEHIIGAVRHDHIEHHPEVYERGVLGLGRQSGWSKDSAGLVFSLTKPKQIGAVGTDAAHYDAMDDGASARLKTYDRTDNLKSFGRLLQKVLNHPEWYSADIRLKLPERIPKNILETRQYLIPLLLSHHLRVDPRRIGQHQILAAELEQLCCDLEACLREYVSHAARIM